MAKQMGQLLAMPMARLRERPMVLLVAALLQAGEEPHCYEEGSMGWVADRPRAVLPDGTISTRLTGVVVRQEEGEWRLVHIHPTDAGGGHIQSPKLYAGELGELLEELGVYA